MEHSKTATIDWELPIEAFIATLTDMLDTTMKNRSVSLPITISIKSVQYFLSVFKCQRCGKCCTKPPEPPNTGELYIAFLPNEFKYARKFISPRQVRKHFKSCPEGYRCSYPCPLHKDGSCSIYARRPLVCIQYPVEIQSEEMGLMVSSECPAGYKAIVDIYTAAYHKRKQLQKEAV